VTKVRGSFGDWEGQAVVAEDFEQSSAKVSIKVASVSTGNEQRDAHLHSNDFFDIENYPEITFVSTSVAVDGDVVNVTGDLTIKGVTKSVTIPFEYTGSAIDPFGNQRIGFEGSITVNRKDWGVNWNAALEAGGVLVSEKVTLEFDVSAIKTA
jgi:polyisoprenoid-binding protein YceI